MKQIALVIALFVSACTQPNEATMALQDAGYTDIEIGGYDVFGCGRDDNYATNFVATSPSGARVRGVVCAGVFKGSTIRTHGRA